MNYRLIIAVANGAAVKVDAFYEVFDVKEGEVHTIFYRNGRSSDCFCATLFGLHSSL